MPDFVISIRLQHVCIDRIESDLQMRPGVEDLAARSWSYPWGVVAVQRSRCPGYEPFVDGKGGLAFAVGRPRRIGWTHENEGETAFSEFISELSSAQSPKSLYSELTGMFVLVACSDKGVVLFTDKMGAYPVYRAASVNGDGVVLGTMPEVVSRLAGRDTDYDVVSLAEILVKNSATFPYTTRNGMAELAPGAKHVLQVGTDVVDYRQEHLWAPTEPDRWPSIRSSSDQLVHALRFAGEDITRGSSKVAVTLSGGADSRTVLSCVPAARRAGAITYMDHENRETQTAAAVAAAAAVPHHLARRNPHFYAQLAQLEAKLLGIERGFVHSHGYAIVESPAPFSYDLLLCGWASDTLLKGCYSPLKPLTAVRSWRRPRWLLKCVSQPLCCSWPAYNVVMDMMRSDIREACEDRMRRRLDEIRQWRPSSAAEWYGFYPLSRVQAASYALANARLFSADQLFIHSALIDVACSSRPFGKAANMVARPAFGEVNQSLAKIVNANTGRVDGCSVVGDVVRRACGRLQRRRGMGVLGKSQYPWYTEGSWVDYERLQRYSEVWSAIRMDAVVRMQTFQRVFSCDALREVPCYVDRAGPSFNYTIVKMACAMPIWEANGSPVPVR